MKKQLFAILISVFFVNALFSAPVITAGITFNEFETAFNNDKVWYAQLQAGSNGTTGADIHELEIGTFDLSNQETITTADFGAGVNWDQAPTSNSFQISVDGSNNLSLIAGGSSINGSDQILNPFNEIWVGLRIITGDDRDNISVNSHQYDGQSINDLTIVDASVNDFAAFKFHDDQETGNIAEFTIDGSLLIDTWANRSKEEWTYTVFAVNNTAIPEPSAYVFILGIIALAAVVSRRK